MWIGINATEVSQRAHVANELLPSGTGEPDQTAVLANRPVIPRSVRLTVGGEPWQEIDDVTAAGPEVPVPDPRQPPGRPSPAAAPSDVFVVNLESGEVRFGDGLRGKRPPLDATIRADYDFGAGRAGNVERDAITTAPALPAGLKVTNPVRTWGGAEGETVAEGEKQIARYLQHRDRLVTAEDFDSISRRTPGVDIGRIEVIPAFNPELPQNEPGDAAGAVTLMVIPKYDPAQPEAPLPDRHFLDAMCAYLDPRRLVTTEVFLRGPTYKPIWVSVGIDVVAGTSVAQVREAVKQEITRFLSPLPPPDAGLPAPAAPRTSGETRQNGWPLRKSVAALEIVGVANRTPGVLLVNNVLLAEGNKPAEAQVRMLGLELPRVMGISVSVGDARPLDELRGQVTPSDGEAGDGGPLVPVPVIPEQC
jgi:predicted phage baseplate assembly protein